MIQLGKQTQPANENLGAVGNWFIGYKSQSECPGANGFKSEFDSSLPCVANNKYRPFGAGLTIETGLSDTACAFKAGTASAAIQNTVVVPQQTAVPTRSGVVFAGGPSGFANATGGLCFRPGGGNTFAGYLQGTYLIAPGGVGALPLYVCAWMVNQCFGGPPGLQCTCGPYSSH
jgi:hypothetical protein